MARTILAAGIAGLIALTAPIPAPAQDEEMAEESQPEPEADAAEAESEPEPEADAAEAEAEPEPEAQFADDFDDPALTDNEFEESVEDELFADDQFNDEAAADTSDDAILVETGNDGIPDAFELYDEDGESDYGDEEELEEGVEEDPFDELDEKIGHFFEELPLIRKPGAGSAQPVAITPAAGHPSGTVSLARLSAPRSAIGLLAGKWHGGGFPGDHSLAGLTGGNAVAGMPATTSVTAPALRLITGISGAINLAPGASKVSLVKDGGAPYQAQIRQAKSPRAKFKPSDAAKYAKTPDWELEHVCGGTLIEPDWVLTAAHCLWPSKDVKAEPLMIDGLNVLLGAENIARPETGRTYRVDRLVIHHGWRPGTPGYMYRHDIALVHLVTGGSAPRVNQISAIDRYDGASPADKTPVSVTGWGKTRELQSHLAATALWRADVGVITNERCRAQPGFEPFQPSAGGSPIARVPPTALCAGESVGKACTGDSGGPLVLTNVRSGRLVGVTSWTKEKSCGKPEIPNVYTRVQAYQAWIESAMRAPGRPGQVTYF